MGNCQAAEAATVVIQHPLGVNGKGRKIERYYQSMSAKDVMNSNPGHYIALIILVPPPANSGGETKSSAPIKQLKLLRPDDVLHLGHVYRLVSFEEVLKEFAAKKCVKLGRLIMKEKVSSGNISDGEKRKKISKSSSQENSSNSVKEQEVVHGGSGNGISNNGSRGGVGGLRLQHHQWRPALESISEIGT